MELVLYPVGGYLVVAAATAMLLVLLAVVRSPSGRLTRRRHVVLSALRGGSLLLVVLALLRPTIVRTETRQQSATLPVLIDASRSMQVADAFGGNSRFSAVVETLDLNQQPLTALTETMDVRGYAFAAETESVDLFNTDDGLPAEPTGEQTAIGAALDDVLRREAGKRVAAVILMSDGAQRALAPRDLAPVTAARQLADLGIPLYVFAVGQSRPLDEARDVAVREMLAGPSVFVKNRLPVSAIVESFGFVGTEIPVRLLFEMPSGEMAVVDTTSYQPSDATRRERVELSYVPEVAGEFKVTVEAVERPGELVTSNNAMSTFVTVRKGGISVLYLEGAVRLEQKFIRRALGGSPEIQVDYVAIDAQRPETRPDDLADRLTTGRYDVFVLGDLDSSAFSQDELNSLVEAVRRGAGLMMLGGFHSFGPGGYGKTALADVLPIEMDILERQNFGEPISPDLHLSGPLEMQPTPTGERHYVTLLSGQDNRSTWAELPPLDGANRFRGLKPRAQVLAETGQGEALLVAQDVGSGRVMAFAADSTWRWWTHGHAEAHRRFWRQAVLWLAHKDEAADGRVWVQLSERRFRPGDPVEFTVGAETSTGEAMLDAQFEVMLVMPDGRREPQRVLRDEDHFRGEFRAPNQVGDYRLSVDAARQGEELGEVSARFLVYEQELELENPAADPTLLAAMARESGGEVLAPEQFAELLERLERQSEQFEINVRSQTTLWDRWPVFFALVALLGVEWWLRKRWSLV